MRAAFEKHTCSLTLCTVRLVNPAHAHDGGLREAGAKKVMRLLRLDLRMSRSSCKERHALPRELPSKDRDMLLPSRAAASIIHHITATGKCQMKSVDMVDTST